MRVMTLVVRQDCRGAAVGHGLRKTAATTAQEVGEDGLSGFGQFAVAADKISVGIGVDDVADGERRQFFEGREHLVGIRRATGIDEYDSIYADLDSDIAACAGDHVEIRPNLNYVEPAAV